VTVSGPVLCVHPNVELYGSDRMFLATVEALASAGVRPVAVLPCEGPLVARLVDSGCEVQIRPFPVLRKKEVRGRRALTWLLRSVMSIAITVRWLRQVRPSTVYVSTLIAPGWVIAARLAGTRVVVHVHENEPSMGAIARTTLQAPLRAAHLLIANSESTRTWLGEGVSRTVPAVTICNGVSLAPPETSTESVRWEDAAQRHLLVVGRLSERKGQDLAVAALAKLRDTGLDVGLTLIGDSFPGYEAFVTGLKAQASRLQVQQHVALLGYRSDASRYMAAADAVLVPSRLAESFGLVAVEAFLVGTPCVVSAVEGLLEIVQDGVNGLAVPPEDPDALAAACQRLLTDAALADSLCAAGIRDARERFSREQYDARIQAALTGQ
jgi:glycosyltransferase involved in cell wall biosynthesis